MPTGSPGTPVCADPSSSVPIQTRVSQRQPVTAAEPPRLAAVLTGCSPYGDAPWWTAETFNDAIDKALAASPGWALVHTGGGHPMVAHSGIMFLYHHPESGYWFLTWALSYFPSAKTRPLMATWTELTPVDRWVALSAVLNGAHGVSHRSRLEDVLAAHDTPDEPWITEWIREVLSDCDHPHVRSVLVLDALSR